MSVPNKHIYLDHNASSPIHPEVIDAVTHTMSIKGNPSSVHTDGRAIRALMEDARESVARAVTALPQAITFVSGGTEANATVIKGLTASGAVVEVLSSSIEHPSVLAHVSEANRVPVTRQGVLGLEKLEELLSARNAPFLFCLMLANNETGVIQPVAEVADLVHSFGGLLLCDAIQGLGKLSMDVNALGADFYTFSAHKIGGPQGVGCIITTGEAELAAFLTGGGQERGKRSGTENVAGICGFGKAAEIAIERAVSYQDARLRNKLEREMMRARPEAFVFGHEVPRLPNTTNISLPGVPSQQQIIKLDLAGFSISAGSACSSGKIEPSHVLEAMGLSPELALSAIRISTGPATTWADLEEFVAVWSRL